MTELVMRGMPCLDAPTYLAVAGLVRALEPQGARVRFEGVTPVLGLPDGLGTREAADLVAAEVVRATHGQGAELPWPAPQASTLREVLNPWLREQWQGNDELFSVDVGTKPVDKTKTDRCSTATRFSTAVNSSMGPGMLNHVLRDLRPGGVKTGAAFDGQVLSWVSDQVEHVLQGQAPVPVRRKRSMLGYSPLSTRAPDRHIGDPVVLEVTEMLAALAITHLAPRGRLPGLPGERWFWWWLNPAPMGWESLRALGRRTWVPGLVGYRSPMCSLGGSMDKYYEFGPVEEMTDPRKTRR